jgi:hypothetical protein
VLEHRRARNPLIQEASPNEYITTLATGQITAIHTITIELVEADETPAVVIISWPEKPTVLHRDGSPTQQLASPACSPRRTRCWRR